MPKPSIVAWTIQMHWSDLGLRLIRAAGALTSALAGISALLTDGAFVKRDPPLGDRWNSPFAKYSVTRWGATLLAVILIAPAVQFIGDWMKDSADAKSQQETAHSVSEEIEHTVKTSTENARRDIVGTVGTVIDQEKELRVKTSEIASGASNILTGIDRGLYPFKDVAWAYKGRINLDHPKMRSFRELVSEGARSIVDRHQNLGVGLPPGATASVSVDSSVLAFVRGGERKRLLVGIDSPFLKETDPAFGAILGYDVFVDFFTKPTTLRQLASLGFRSSDYAVTLLSPYSSDGYEMAKAGQGFPPESYRSFELIYFPANDDDPSSDQCYVDYYWHALRKFDILTERSQTRIVGLPDLRSSLFVVRLETVADYWGSIAPYSLESLRMRVVAQVLTLSRSDFNAPESRNGYLLYRKTMPGDFDAVLQLF